MNDYAIALVSPEPIPVDRLEPDVLTDIENLPSDIIESLNLSQMMRFQFRDIARIAGLVTSGFPNRGKSAKQLQASSNLFFDVFGQYDPKNLLLEQARREVLAGQLQWEQLTRTMQQLKTRTWRIVNLKRPTPFAFPLVVERLRDRVSTETLLSRVRKMQESLEREASKKNPPHWSSRSSSKSSPATSRDEGAQSVD